jgi:beta-lactamase class A
MGGPDIQTQIETLRAIELLDNNDDTGFPDGLDRRQFIGAIGGTAVASLLLGIPFAAEAAAQQTLQSELVRLVKRQRARGLIRSDERTSWSVYDFTAGKKLVSINENVPRQAASMIKPFVAQAFFYTVKERGSKLKYSQSVRNAMVRMIRNSSNSATNEIMDIVIRHNGGN